MLSPAPRTSALRGVRYLAAMAVVSALTFSGLSPAGAASAATLGLPANVSSSVNPAGPSASPESEASVTTSDPAPDSPDGTAVQPDEAGQTGGSTESGDTAPSEPTVDPNSGAASPSPDGNATQPEPVPTPTPTPTPSRPSSSLGLTPSFASGATFTLGVTRVNSGTGAVDAAATCPTQGTPTPADHCAGLDTSLAAADQIIRAGDTATVTFNFGVDAAEPLPVLTSTFPLSGSSPAATWPSIPSSCLSTGSSISADRRTLTCAIAPIAGATSGSISATFTVGQTAADGFTLTVGGQMSGSVSPTVAAATQAVFTVSNSPRYVLTKNEFFSYNVLPAPFFYKNPAGEPGYAVPSTTYIRPTGLGGASLLQSPVTWHEDTSQAPAGTVLLNWGNYGNGCGSQSTASNVSNPGFTNLAVPISNQVGPSFAGQFTCSQPGGANTPITVSMTNPGPGTVLANMWVMLWVPLASLPAGNSTIPLATSAFAPTDVAGAANLLGAQPDTSRWSRNSGLIVQSDRASISKATELATNPTSSVSQTGRITFKRGDLVVSNIAVSNTGTVDQGPLQVCDRFDSTVLRLADFSTVAGSTTPAGTYVVAVTKGPATDPVLPAAYHPGSGYNNTTNFAVDPSAYTVEFAAGDFGSGSPVAAPQSMSDISSGSCGSGTATGWHSSPDDPAIAAYAASLGGGLTARDVVNRVRVTFTGGSLLPGEYVGVKILTAVRDTFRPATDKAGTSVVATTPLNDSALVTYPQQASAVTVTAAPRIEGLLGEVNVRIAKSASVSGVQAGGSAGTDTVTYTLGSNILIGEGLSTSQPVRIIDYLPASMRYLLGSASVAPSLVLPQPDNSTVLVWDLGNVTGVVGQTVNLPSITYSARADALAPAPSVNYNGAVIESRRPDGTLIDPRTPYGCSSTYLQIDVPATSSVPISTQVAVPPPANYAPCAGQGGLFRYAFVAVSIGNAFVFSGGKIAGSTTIDTGEADGVNGATVSWDVKSRNTSTGSLAGLDVVDVLPFNGDGRTPASSFSGTFLLTSVSVNDPDGTSATPNALPTSAGGPFPARSGSTVYVTKRPSAQVVDDPYDASNLAGGTTKWCVLSDTSAGCPANLTQVTAVRVISGELSPLEERSFRLGFATSGNVGGNVYSNTATARAIGIASPVVLKGDSIQVVSSSLSGHVWDDADGDGVLDASESGLGGVEVTLDGLSATGTPTQQVTHTAADGSYSFAGLRSGNYTVTVKKSDVLALNAGYASTFDPQHGTASPSNIFTVAVAKNSLNPANNVGFATQSLSGVVYNDVNDNGAQDSGESGYAGVQVTLSGQDDLGATVTRSVTTGADGSYTFAGLRPGTYSVTKVQNAGRLPGKNTAGSAGGTAGAPGTNTIQSIVLGVAANATGYLLADLAPGELVLTKVADASGVGSPAAVGDTITYTFTVSNTGGVPVSGVTISDPMSGLSALTYVWPTPASPGVLARGETVTATATYHVTQADIDAGHVGNTATASGQDPFHNVVVAPGVATDTPLTVPGAALSLTKVADASAVGSPVHVGDTITYTFTVSNTGGVSLSGVAVSDPLPGLSALTYAWPTPASPGVLAPGGVATATATYHVTQADIDAGHVGSTASASGQNPSHTPVTAPGASTDTPLMAAGSLEVTKAADASAVGVPAQVGDTITYTFTVSNTGNVTVSGVTVADPLPGLSAITYVWPTPASPGVLAPGGVATATATYHLTQADIDAGHRGNTATAAGQAPAGATVAAPGVSTDTPLTAVGSLAVTKVADASAVGTPAHAGDTITYTFTVSNTGNVTVSGVTVADPLPGLSTISYTWPTPASPGRLAPGEVVTATATYEVTQGDIDAGRVDNTATATGQDPVGATVTAPSVSATTPLAAAGALVATKTADASAVGSPAAVGDTITYAFTVSNTGNVTVSGVTVSDPLPGLSTISYVWPTPASPGVLAPGEVVTATATYHVTQADIDAGHVGNTATASGQDPFHTTVNAPAASTETPLTATGSMAVTKVADASAVGSPASVGDTITYTFTVSNTGGVSLSGVSVSDPLPGLSTISYVWPTPASPGVLAPGDVVTATATYHVTQADIDAGHVGSTATASGQDPSHTTVTASGVSTDTPLTAAGSMALTKVADASGVGTPARVGDTITYGFTVSNTGNVSLTGVSVSDVLPGLSAITYVWPNPATPGALAPGEVASATATYQVTQADIDAGRVENTATASGSYEEVDPGPSTTDVVVVVSAASTVSVPLVKASAPVGTLALTGVNVVSLAVIAALLVLGGVLLAASRRRRDEESGAHRA